MCPLISDLLHSPGSETKYTSSPIETDDTRGIEAPLVRTLVLLTVYPEFILKASIPFAECQSILADNKVILDSCRTHEKAQNHTPEV